MRAPLTAGFAIAGAALLVVISLLKTRVSCRPQANAGGQSKYLLTTGWLALSRVISPLVVRWFAVVKLAKASLPEARLFISQSVSGLLLRHWLARQFLVLHRCVVDKRSHNRCRLLQVVGLNTIEHILV